MAFTDRLTACRKKQPRPCSFCRLGIKDLQLSLSFQQLSVLIVQAHWSWISPVPTFSPPLFLTPTRSLAIFIICHIWVGLSFMRRLSSTRLPQLLNSARPPLSRPPRAAPLSRLLSVSASTPPPSFSPPRANRPSRRSPLSQSSKRYCSYRRMCGSRRAGVSGSTNVPDREVLPTNVKPTHYDLTLEPNFETFKYEGTVVIE